MFKDFKDYLQKRTPEQAKVDLVTKMLKEGVDIIHTISQVIPEANREIIHNAFRDFLSSYYKLNYYSQLGGKGGEKRISIHNIEAAVIALAQKDAIKPTEMKMLAKPILEATYIDKDNPTLLIMENFLVDLAVSAQRPPDILPKETLMEKFGKLAERWRSTNR